MIIHEKFVWLHLGKTGGTTVARIFLECEFPGVEEIIHGYRGQHWTIADYLSHRDRSLEGRDIIINIRPLIPWMQSHQFQKERRQKAPFLKDRFLAGEIPYRSPEGRFDWWHADFLLSRFLDPEPTAFIRQTHLADDFVQVFSRYFDFTSEQLAIIRETHANPTRNPLPEHLHLTTEEQASLQRCCPVWMKQLEKAEAHHRGL